MREVRGCQGFADNPVESGESLRAGYQRNHCLNEWNYNNRDNFGSHGYCNRHCFEVELLRREEQSAVIHVIPVIVVQLLGLQSHA